MRAPYSKRRRTVLGSRATAVPPDLAEIESLSGNHAAAAEQLDLRLDWEHKRGITGNAAFTLAWQARELALAGRHDEAEQRVAQAAST